MARHAHVRSIYVSRATRVTPGAPGVRARESPSSQESSTMTDSASIPFRGRRRNSFAGRRVSYRILSLSCVGVSVGVLLCLVALGRIGGLDDSRRDLYENSVVAFSDLDVIQAGYESIRQRYTAYVLADRTMRAD